MQGRISRAVHEPTVSKQDNPLYQKELDVLKLHS